MKLLVLAAIAVAVPANASDWRPVGRAADGAIVTVDNDTVRGDAGHGRAWYRFDYSKVRGKRFRYEKQYLEVDCEAETITEISVVRLTATGASIYSRTIPEILREAEPAAPDSIGASMLKAICHD